MNQKTARLIRLSVALSEYARRLAEQGNTHRAMRSLALAEALHYRAGGDEIGAKLALKDAKSLRKAERRERHAQGLPADLPDGAVAGDLRRSGTHS